MFLRDYVDELHAKGRYWFSKAEAMACLNCSEDALRMALNRLQKSGRIARVMREFYVIVPPEYKSSGILPPQLFVEGLMRHANTSYYIGLLSAAAMHGAAHQQPQEFHIMVPEPRRSLRPKGLHIRFFVKKAIEAGNKVRLKTDTGYVTVSSPELTALDITAYQKRIGGLGRVTTVVEELCDAIDNKKLAEEAKTYPCRAAIQRLGYILSHVLQQDSMAEGLYSILETRSGLATVPLDPAQAVKSAPRGNRWNVLVNTEVESEL